MQQQLYSEEGQGPIHSQTQNYTRSRNTVSPNSLLVVDCGTVFTKVSLFGLVEGQYRLIARGEAPSTTGPDEDITLGIVQAVNTIEWTTGRHFISSDQLLSPEQDNGDGVDVCITTISAGGPLRLVVMGAVSPILENLMTQAVSGLYAEVHMVPSPSFTAASAPLVSVGAGTQYAQTPTESWTQERIALEWEHQLALLTNLQPHVALIVGTADGPTGPNPLQEACQLLINAAQDPNTPTSQCSVLYGAAPQYVDAVRRMLSGVADVARVDPLVSHEQLGSISTQIGTLHEHNVIQQIPGYEHLCSWSSSTPVATATSLSSLVRFLAQHYGMNVAAVDIGGANTTVLLAGEHGEYIPYLNPGIGVGPAIGAILQQAGAQRVARWLPFSLAEGELRQFALNRMLHPQVIPTESRELHICHAFAREAIILTLEAAKKNNTEWPLADLILATGGVFAHAPHYGQMALMLLDALQPRGVTSLVVDRMMLIAQLGAVASVAPIAAVQVNENDAVTYRLGTCIAPFGTVQDGQLAIRVGVDYGNGKQVSVDVMGGSIEVIPLKLNEQALLTLFPAPTIDVGLGPGERARAAEEIDGGLIGLIIDARGRPLVLPSDDVERQMRLSQWMRALGAGVK